MVVVQSGAAPQSARHPRHEPPQRRDDPRPQPAAPVPPGGRQAPHARPLPAHRRADTRRVRHRRLLRSTAGAARGASAPRGFRRQTQPRLGGPRRLGDRRPRRRRVPAPQRRARGPGPAASTFLRHPLGYVFARGTPRRSNRSAARPIAPRVCADQLQGHPRHPRDLLPQRTGDGDAAAADHGVQRPRQPPPGRHRHRRGLGDRRDASRRLA